MKLFVGPRGREASAGTLRDILRIRKLNGEVFGSDIFPVNVSDHPRHLLGHLQRQGEGDDPLSG